MKKYSQLTDVLRYKIEALKKAEKDQKTIAEIIGVSASTISRELKRNTGQRGYRPKQAHIKALKRRKGAANERKYRCQYSCKHHSKPAVICRIFPLYHFPILKNPDVKITIDGFSPT